MTIIGTTPLSNENLGCAQSPKEGQWVKRVREESDRYAFEQVFRSYYKRLHGYAYSFVNQKQEAEDIVQTIFLNIWAHREEWKPPGTLKHYLFAAIRNEALNRLRPPEVVDSIRTIMEREHSAPSLKHFEMEALGNQFP